MFCQACGQSLSQFATACSRCGAPIGTGVRSVPVQSPLSTPLGGSPLATPMGYSPKSKVVAGVLQIVLGGLGAGRFYTGHIGIAIAQIAVTWLTCGLGGIWPLVDGILMLMGRVPDAEGRPLRD